ncbi:hypothetical protein QUB70_25135 [Microcoleus sp. A003_D6]
MTKHWPLWEKQNTLRLMQTAWTSYHSVTLAGAIAQLSFKQLRKSLTIKNPEKKESRGAMYLYLTLKLSAKTLVQKNMPVCLGLIFGSPQKSRQSWKSGLFPR